VTERQTQTAAYWSEAFEIEDSDLDYLYNLLLEEETPLSTLEMALAIIERRVEREAQAARRREQGTTLYVPKATYTVGQQLVFSALDYAAPPSARPDDFNDVAALANQLADPPAQPAGRPDLRLPVFDDRAELVARVRFVRGGAPIDGIRCVAHRSIVLANADNEVAQNEGHHAPSEGERRSR